MDFLSILKDKKRIRGTLIVIFLLAAIPLTIYLVFQKQIFKSKALGEGSTLQAFAANGAELPDNNPADGIKETQSQDISLKLTWNPGAAQLTPSPTHAPSPTTSAPTATTAPTAVPTTAPTQTPAGVTLTASTPVAPGGNITVTWGGVNNATDPYWLIGTPGTTNGVYLIGCTKTQPSQTSSVPSSGTCPLIAPATAGPYTVEMYHFNITNSELQLIKISNQFTVTGSSVPTSIPSPTQVVGSISGYVYNDSNGDGQKSANEIGVSNVNVAICSSVYHLATGMCSPAGSTYTDSTGFYIFPNLSLGWGAEVYLPDYLKQTFYTNPIYAQTATVPGSVNFDLSNVNVQQ